MRLPQAPVARESRVRLDFPSGWSEERRRVRKSSLTLLSESAATRRLNHEYVARLHFDLKGCAELFPRSVGALDPVASHGARLAARDAERRDAPVIGEHDRGHRLEEAYSSLAAVAAAMISGAATATSNPIRLETHGKAPFEHFGIGQPRVGHVRLHHARAVEVRAGARAARDRLVILVLSVTEREIVHRALRSGEHA